MAERRIQDFAVAADAQDNNLLLVSSNGETYTVTVKTLKDSLQRGDGISDNAKNLILSLFEGAAYGNSSMQTILNSLKAEWNGSSGGNTGGGGTTTVAVQSVSLSRSTLSLTAGSSSPLTATVSPSNATNKTVTWSVSPSGYASLSATTGSNVTVTASKVGNCTVTATAGGKSARCSVTVTASSGGNTGGGGTVNDSTDVAGETPVYKLAQATEFTPAKALCIDTGIQMFSTINPQPSWTILFEVQYNSSLTGTYGNHMLLHCMEEQDPWPGLVVKAVKSGDLQVVAYGYSKVLGTASALDIINNKRKFAIKIEGGLIHGWSYNGNMFTSTSGSDITNYTQTVSKNLIIGAYQEMDGSKGSYFDGTLHQCVVYNKALTDAQIAKWIAG